MQTTVSPVTGAYWEWHSSATGSTDPYSIYYVKADGKSGDRHRPPLLLVHGFGASTDHWRKNIEDLSEQYEVWAIDLLGFGRSQKPVVPYSSTLWREQLKDFITQVIQQPVVIAGNSIGAYGALSTAVESPESVAGVITLNCVGSFTSTEPPPAVNPVRQAMFTAIRMVLLSPAPLWLIFQNVRRRSYIRKTLSKVYVDQSAVTDRLVEEIYRPACEPTAAQAFGAMFQSPPGEKLDVLLQQLRCPLMTIWGVGDPWMRGRGQGERFRAFYPDLTEHYIDSGHCPHDESPQLVNPMIREWMEQVFGA
jgi:pimeloyl-ACP methyl ester carboxylesterase